MDTPSLGTIITNHTVRRWLYITYGILALAAAAAQAGFSAIHMPAPTWFHAAVAILAFLALPFAGLAVANVPTVAKAPAPIPDPTPVAAIAAPVAVQAPIAVPTPADPGQPAAGTQPAAVVPDAPAAVPPVTPAV